LESVERLRIFRSAYRQSPWRQSRLQERLTSQEGDAREIGAGAFVDFGDLVVGEHEAVVAGRCGGGRN
jgi:hypothetical protein